MIEPEYRCVLCGGVVLRHVVLDRHQCPDGRAGVAVPRSVSDEEIVLGRIAEPHGTTPVGALSGWPIDEPFQEALLQELCSVLSRGLARYDYATKRLVITPLGETWLRHLRECGRT